MHFQVLPGPLVDIVDPLPLSECAHPGLSLVGGHGQGSVEDIGHVLERVRQVWPLTQFFFCFLIVKTY